MGKGSVDGRPKALKPEIRNLITNWATEDVRYRDLDRELLADKLIDEIEGRGEIAPTVSTLKAYISTDRNQTRAAVDYPWSMSILRDTRFSLQSEVIPYVVEIQQKQKNIVPLGDVSIRQAQWISRLCKVVKDIDALSIISWYYALYERVTEKAGTQFDTTKPDNALPDKDKVVEAFQDLLQAASFKVSKPVFDDMATTKLSENKMMEIDTIWLESDSVIAVDKIPCKDNQGRKFHNHLRIKNLGLQSKILPDLVKNGIIKKQKNYHSNVYLKLRKPIMIEIRPDELSKIDNFLKPLTGKSEGGEANG
jgi:hypothetical protein